MECQLFLRKGGRIPLPSNILATWRADDHAQTLSRQEGLDSRRTNRGWTLIRTAINVKAGFLRTVSNLTSSLWDNQIDCPGLHWSLTNMCEARFPLRKILSGSLTHDRRLREKKPATRNRTSWTHKH